jgi:hypothetical protein
MGKQLNFYRSAELMAELEAEATAQSKSRCGQSKATSQECLRLAWDLRPEALRMAERKAKKAVAK